MHVVLEKVVDKLFLFMQSRLEILIRQMVRQVPLCQYWRNHVISSTASQATVVRW